MMIVKPLTPTTGFAYKFIRVNPKINDYLNLNYLVDKYGAYVGYTFEHKPNRRYLKGFVVFPVKVPIEYISRRLPNYLIDFVKEFNKIETRFRNNPTTVWRNQHPLKPIKTNLLKQFDDADREK